VNGELFELEVGICHGDEYRNTELKIKNEE
jgi:hypothetical protein